MHSPIKQIIIMKYFVKHAKNTTCFSGEATENHPWRLCLSDGMTIGKAGIKGNKFNAYADGMNGLKVVGMIQVQRHLI